MKGADVFVGVSAKDLVTPEMLKTMAANPIVFAMANPDPEIPYPLAVATRKDVIMATGRSDYPNQVNNVLGFPFIFRGALDVRATAINNEMKMAAARALAALAKEDVPEVVLKAYGVNSMSFGREYLIPEAVRSARADVGGAGGGEGRVRHGRRRASRSPTGTPTASSSSGCSGPSRKVMHFVVRKARNDDAAAHRVPRGRARLHHPRRPRHRRSEDRDAGAARQRGGDPRQRRRGSGIEQIDFEIVNVPDPQHEQRVRARRSTSCASARASRCRPRSTWCTTRPSAA